MRPSPPIPRGRNIPSCTPMDMHAASGVATTPEGHHHPVIARSTDTGIRFFTHPLRTETHERTHTPFLP
jgi:hypothetical protein